MKAKRIGETDVRKALNDGAKIKAKCSGAGYNIILDGKNIGYTVSTVVCKLIGEQTIVKSKGDMSGTYVLNPKVSEEENC